MLQKIIKNVNNFDDIKDRMSSLKVKEKGDLFEEFTKYLFMFHPYYENEFENVWLYNEIPINIKKLLKLPTKDEGIDLLLLSKDGKYYAVQCKYRTNLNTVIKWGELGTFAGLSFGVANNIYKGFFVTNTLEITRNIKVSDKIIGIYGTFFDDIPNIVFDKIKHLLIKTNIVPELPLKPLIHQRNAVRETLNYFTNNNRGYLEMACGSGKTLTSMWILDYLKTKLSIIVVPSLYLLSQIYREYIVQSTLNNRKKNFILVGSDCDVGDEEYHNGLLITTNPDEITEKIKFYSNNVILICTYQSSDKVITSLNSLKIESDLCIFDEAHKTVGQKGKQFNLLLDDKNLVIKKRLFMTATPKMYGGNDENEKIYSMDDEEWYGKKIFTYNTGDAINDNRLCDYKIVTMISNDKYLEDFIKNNNYVGYEKDGKIAETNSEYLSTAIMLLNAFKKGECHHLITYHNNIANTKEFEEIFKSLLKVCNLNVEVLRIDGNDSMRYKRATIKSFVNSKSAILISAKVLNEGVNIPIINLLN